MNKGKVTRALLVWTAVGAGALLYGCGSSTSVSQIATPAATAGVARLADGRVSSAPAPSGPSPIATVAQPSPSATPDRLIDTPTGPDAQPLTGPTATQLRREAQQLSLDLQQTPITRVDPQGCHDVVNTYPFCRVLTGIKPIVRPEWQALFPQATFFAVQSVPIVKAGGAPDALSPGTGQSMIVARQDGVIYSHKEFEALLNNSNIAITHQNRQNVIKAYILMTIGRRATDEVRFTLKGVNIPLVGDIHYSEGVDVWTKIQGLQLSYLCAFDKTGLAQIEGAFVKYNVVQHIDAPLDDLPLPTSSDLSS